MRKPLTFGPPANSRQIPQNPACSPLSPNLFSDINRELPDALAQYRNLKTKAAAEAGAIALVEYLKKKHGEGTARRVCNEDITVGAWIEKFTAMETSPRTGVNASRNRPYSPDTVETYRGYYNTHIKGDPFTLLKMAEVEEEDATEYITRLSVKKLAAKKGKAGRPMGGSRTFAGVIIFIRMTFTVKFRDYCHRQLAGFHVSVDVAHELPILVVQVYDYKTFPRVCLGHRKNGGIVRAPEGRDYTGIVVISELRPAFGGYKSVIIKGPKNWQRSYKWQ